MINVLAAFDESDIKLGEYFKACKNDLLTIIKKELENGQNFTTLEISSKNCHSAYFDIILSRYKEIPFLIVAYSHGNEKCLTVNGVAYISAGNDNSFFQKSFFYTNSCLSGKILGPDLIEQNCKVFIGYEEIVVAFKDERQDISIKCDNIGISMFLTGEITAYEAYLKMKDYYTQSANKLLKFNDILASGLLINAREALVFYGDKNCKKEDLMDTSKNL